MSKWQEITVETTEEAYEAVANLFYEVGAAGVVIEDPRVIARYLEERQWESYELPSELIEAENIVIKGYLPVDERLESRLDFFQERLAGLGEHFSGCLARLSLAEIAEADWSTSWKTHYKPEKIGERIVVSPSWEDYTIKKGELLVSLDPGMAFGTGYHPTTALAIRALEKYLQPGFRVIDVGTGSGILAIVAACLGATRVLALDVDILAVQIAEQNVLSNRVDDIVTVRYNDFLTGVTEEADLIVANINSDATPVVAEQSWERLKRGGILITSGIIADRQIEIVASLEDCGYHLEETNEEDEWVSLVARKV
ncbi:MAG TPA: 50S ribosomal protein L11 methyltransferase [Clostridia bacterium]|nr:50S ribosomal protein L11 methyltransferase [Clostridia bacterium]